MSVRSRVRRSHHDAPELNITAFLNLMVILVPFLLITAVFSHMTILELNLPPKNNKPPEQKDKKDDKKESNFELILRQNEITVNDTLNGPLRTYTPKTPGGLDYDYAEIQSLLKTIKNAHPDKKNLSILSESGVSYDLLIQAMDTVRVQIRQDDEGNTVQEELFPKIAIGDAPEKPGAEPSPNP